MTVDPEELERLKGEKARWERETLGDHLAKSPERTEPFTTVSGQPIRRLYTPLDVPDLDASRDLGFPGEYPFTRGVQPTMYRGRFWTMRQ
jgi:methylmalonyl-CoA mutase, N-terminal domain